MTSYMKLELIKQTAGTFPDTYTYRKVILLSVQTVKLASDLMDTIQSHAFVMELLGKFAFFFFFSTDKLS